MNGYLKIKTKIDNNGVDKQIQQLENKLNDLKATLKMADEDKKLFSKSQVLDMEVEVEKLTNQLKKLKKQQEKATTGDWDKVKGSIDNVNKGLSSTVKKVGKWALAIFSVRSAYSGIRSVMSTLSQYDKQMAADLEYMKFAIANSLKPLIEGMINLAFKLLNYVNYIAKAWFNVDLFANASADAMNKSAKASEKMNKSIAGFDEMTIAGDTSTSGGGSVSPSQSLQAPENFQPPEWLVWIKDNKDTLIEAILGIAGGILAVKLGLEGIQALGIAVAITGIIELLEDLNNWIDEMGDSLDENKISWENLGNTLQHIGIIILSVGLAIGSTPIAVAGALIAIVGLIAKNWDKIRSKGYEIINWLRDNFGIVGNIIATPIEMALDLFDGLFKGVKGIIGGIIKMFKGDFAGGLTSIFKGVGNMIIGVLNALITGFNGVIYPIRSLIVAAGKVTGKNWTMDNIRIPKIPYLAVGGIVNNPGHGVLMNGYVAGESGREGILPLTDPNAMAQLGREIGKWIRVNNVSNTYLDGRLIKRNQDQINEEFNFATNGGVL